MQLIIGEKVTYPSQGVCLVEEFKFCKVGDRSMSGYSLRILNDNSTIFVPSESADNVGIRPVISAAKAKALIAKLSEDFEPVSCDWKTRSRDYMEKLRTGDVFEAADVLKKLTFLSHEKKLSFREQTLLDKARFLIVSEITNAKGANGTTMENQIVNLIERACAKHLDTQPKVMAVAIH